MICDMSNSGDLSFYWWELTSEVCNVRGIVLTWQVWRLVTPCRGAISESLYSLGSMKFFFIVRGVVLNLTMIESVDLPLYGRKLVGEFGGK